MDRIYIIGNGFDCAHNLKTRYIDFLNWYVSQCFKTANDLGSFKNEHFVISKNTEDIIDLDENLNISYFMEFYKNNFGPKRHNRINFIFAFSWESKSEFIHNLIFDYLDSGWVDIEKGYYNELKKLVSKHNLKLDTNNFDISDLNYSFDLLKMKLIEYLKSIETKTVNTGIQNLLDLNSIPHKNQLEPKKFFIINFNYTNTIEKYINYNLQGYDIPLSYELVYIHGEIFNVKFPIIFGYGDETDSYFSKIEELDNPEFVKHFKSDAYGLNPHYRKISKFIELNPFEVHILGHSCGSSDRVLLKAIFDNPNCKEIKIFHHKRENGSNDFIDIYRNISRCFSIENRHSFKSKTVNYEKSNQMPQIKKV